MSARFFLDTNIFVHTFDSSVPVKSRKATQLIKRASDSGAGIVSYQVVQEFFNVAFRRLQPPMTTGEAEQYLITVFRPLIAVHSSPALFMEGMRIAAKHRLPWYDSLILAAALEGQCDLIYSEDFQQGRTIEGLRIENPFT